MRNRRNRRWRRHRNARADDRLPSCGTWVCGNCGRLPGHMAPTRHSNRGRAEEHLAGHLEVTAAGIMPMYQFEASAR